MNKLAVFGDSWACGSFSNENDGWTGVGDFYFQRRLSDNFEIINFATGGLSNIRTLSRLNDYLELYNTKVLVVQTDPIRDCYPNHDYGMMKPSFYEIFKGNMKQYAETQIELFYFQLDLLAEKYNAEINLIGGCSDVHPSVEKYKNVKVLCYSWFELIDKHHKHGLFSNTTNLGHLVKNSDREIVDQIYYKQMIINREQGKMFGYGGDNHPSHSGQDLMINHLIGEGRL